MEDKERERSRETDLVLTPGEYAFVLDKTKGPVSVFVGPFKTSLSGTDQPATYNEITKRFEYCTLDKSIRAFSSAPEGWYIVLKNPAKDSKLSHPQIKSSGDLADLNYGRKVNIPGPAIFPLWPGQTAEVVQGHYLRSNQYLLVRVYDEASAKENWAEAVVKPQNAESQEKIIKGIPELIMGKTLIIKGTDISFYIPPTGIEVVPISLDKYVREAVTLERLEYCILLDESGNKRYIKGPAVVFPEPTETFVEENNLHSLRKFKAIELNEISGIYVKVIADYEENGKQYKVGDELFITGKEQMIYFPRQEHAIVKYGDREKNYAVAIPTGEARYVLNKLSGEIILVKGPQTFLPDPRKEVIVRRVLDPKTAGLWFPQSGDAVEYNKQLVALMSGTKADYISDHELKDNTSERVCSGPDELVRKNTFTPPRTLVLNTKYEGAVAINVWTGYAVLVVNKRGDRRVVVGPQTLLLEYDESIEGMELSTGKPKTTDKLLQTAYLRVKNNKVSDILVAETNDLCRVEIKVSYRVNFEGDSMEWFDVENYVKFLTDHLRSIISNTVKHHGIQDFYASAIDIIRDAVLGKKIEDKERPGKVFIENGMKVYDMEVLKVSLDNEKISGLLIVAQHNAVKQAIEAGEEEKRLQLVSQKEKITQQIEALESTTRQERLALQILEAQKQAELALAKLESEFNSQKLHGDILEAKLARDKAQTDQGLALEKEKLEQRLIELKAQVEAVKEKASALTPDFIAALQAFSDKDLAGKMAESMAPMAILGGKSVADVFGQLLQGTSLESVLKNKIGANK